MKTFPTLWKYLVYYYISLKLNLKLDFRFLPQKIVTGLRRKITYMFVRLRLHGEHVSFIISRALIPKKSTVNNSGELLENSE